jgi:hypothetical protein
VKALIVTHDLPKQLKQLTGRHGQTLRSAVSSALAAKLWRRAAAERMSSGTAVVTAMAEAHLATVAATGEDEAMVSVSSGEDSVTFTDPRSGANGECEWAEATDALGRVYYWNKNTRQTSWELPSQRGTGLETYNSSRRLGGSSPFWAARQCAPFTARCGGGYRMIAVDIPPSFLVRYQNLMAKNHTMVAFSRKFTDVGGRSMEGERLTDADLAPDDLELVLTVAEIQELLAASGRRHAYNNAWSVCESRIFLRNSKIYLYGPCVRQWLYSSMAIVQFNGYEVAPIAFRAVKRSRNLTAPLVGPCLTLIRNKTLQQFELTFDLSQVTPSRRRTG